MKKLISILLTLALLAIPVLALAEAGEDSPEIALTGDWYAQISGVTVKLTLHEDGSYALAVVGLNGAEKTGTWALQDGAVYLDGSLAPDLVLQGDRLWWTDAEAFLTRSAAEGYVPAEILDGAALEDFAGYWKTCYVSVGDAVMEADALGVAAEVCLDGVNAALGGDLFGDVIVEMICGPGSRARRSKRPSNRTETPVCGSPGSAPTAWGSRCFRRGAERANSSEYR